MISVIFAVIGHLDRRARSKLNFGLPGAVLLVLVCSLALAGCSDNGGGSYVPTEPAQSLTVNFTHPSAPCGLDRTPPTIVIDSPSRGAMLTAATPTDPVTISGTVEDALTDISSITVNGEPLDIAGTNPREAIDVQRAAHWGTNIITIEATDRCLNVARHSQAFLQSSRYLELAPDPDADPDADPRVPGARVRGALVVGLKHEAIDDDDRDAADDLTTLAQEALNTHLPAALQKLKGVQLFEKTITGPLEAHCDYSGVIPAGSAPSIGHVLLGTRLEAGFTVHDTTVLNIVISVRYREACFGPFGGLLSDISAVFTHTVQLFLNSTALELEVRKALPNVSVLGSTSGLFGHKLDSKSNPALATVISGVIPGFEPLISFFLNKKLEPEIKKNLPKLVLPFIESIAKAPVVPITFPPPFDLTLNATADWDEISVSGEEIVQTLGQYVYPSAVGTPHPARGAITADVPPRAVGAYPGPVTFALSDDGINQMFWAFWYGGGLEIPGAEAYAATLLGDKVDLSGVSLDLSGSLPPVLMPGAGSRGLVLGLGGLRVDGSIDMDLNATLPGSGVANVPGNSTPPSSGVVELTGYATLLLDAEPVFNIAGNTLGLQDGPVGYLYHFDLDTITLNGLPVSDAALRDAVIQYIESILPLTMRGILKDLGGKVNLPPLDLPLPSAVFGPDRSLILDIVRLERDADRFVVDIDPDVHVQVTPPIVNWAELALVAADAARREAGQWLDAAFIAGCSVERDFAFGEAVLFSGFAVTGGVKNALTAAGAPDNVARNWDRAFKSAWDEWRLGVGIPSLSWYPEFRHYAPTNEPKYSAGNIPSPLGDLVSSGREAMSPAGLKSRLIIHLGDSAGQADADAAFTAFADDLGGRMDDQLRSSLVQNVPAEAVSTGMDFNPNKPPTRPPLRGPLRGTCEGGEITGNYFWP